MEWEVIKFRKNNGWVESEVSMLRSPQATTCLWDSSNDSKVEHSSETEEDGALGRRYIQLKVKEDKEDLKELIDSHRVSTSP